MTASSNQDQLALLSTLDMCTNNNNEVVLPSSSSVQGVAVSDPAFSSGQNDEEDTLAVENDTPSVVSFTDSPSEADGINDVWLNTDIDASSTHSCHIEFDSNLLADVVCDNEDEEEEQEVPVPVKAEDDDDFEDDPRRFGNRRSVSLRSNFRAGGNGRVASDAGGSNLRTTSMSSFLRERGPRSMDDDDSLVRNRMGREKNSRTPSWSDSILDIMGDDEDCIEVPMKE